MRCTYLNEHRTVRTEQMRVRINAQERLWPCRPDCCNICVHFREVPTQELKGCMNLGKPKITNKNIKDKNRGMFQTFCRL